MSDFKMPAGGRVADAFATIPDTEEAALGGNLPALDLTDPAQLEAFYGNFAFFDHYRKSVLAECREIIRAKFVGEKITEARLDDLARLHKNYLDFLAEHFTGRHQREQNVYSSLRNGA
jgi:hypothetical protein